MDMIFIVNVVKIYKILKICPEILLMVTKYGPERHIATTILYLANQHFF